MSQDGSLGLRPHDRDWDSQAASQAVSQPASQAVSQPGQAAGQLGSQPGSRPARPGGQPGSQLASQAACQPGLPTAIRSACLAHRPKDQHLTEEVSTESFLTKHTGGRAVLELTPCCGKGCSQAGEGVSGSWSLGVSRHAARQTSSAHGVLRRALRPARAMLGRAQDGAQDDGAAC